MNRKFPHLFILIVILSLFSLSIQTHAAAALPKALRQLVNRDILELVNGGYRFRVELVRR